MRDFSTAGLEEKETFVEELARAVDCRAPASRASKFAIAESYRNMREILEGYPEVIECAREAIRRSGLTPVERPIRGGTDGSRLSFMGLPTPNIFAGEHNFHSRLEWVSAQDMDKAVETIVNLCRVWEEKTAESDVGQGSGLRLAANAESSSHMVDVFRARARAQSLERYYCSVKFTVTVMMTGTATPFSSVGSNCHWLTASTAA